MPTLTLQEVLENLLPKAQVYEKSVKDKKPLLASVPKGTFEYINSRIEILGNDFRINDQKYFIQTSSLESVDENTGEVKTRYFCWFNIPQDTIVEADNVVPNDAIEMRAAA